MLIFVGQEDCAMLMDGFCDLRLMDPDPLTHDNSSYQYFTFSSKSLNICQSLILVFYFQIQIPYHMSIFDDIEVNLIVIMEHRRYSFSF